MFSSLAISKGHKMGSRANVPAHPIKVQPVRQSQYRHESFHSTNAGVHSHCQSEQVCRLGSAGGIVSVLRNSDRTAREDSHHAARDDRVTCSARTARTSVSTKLRPKTSLGLAQLESSVMSRRTDAAAINSSLWTGAVASTHGS